MALATDHRPKSLDELHGNVELKATLKSKLNLETDKCPHVYLLTGNKGCGKTTIARIIASHLKCNALEFNEIDATDESGGVAAVRDLKRSVRYPPMAGNVRIWFIDECHMISPKGQEAFLKLLEEPPKFAYFVLATTEPQKLIKTLKDRCVCLEVKPLSNKEMTVFVNGIINIEDVAIPSDIIEKIIERSDGHPRAALQFLEKVIDLDPSDMKNIEIIVSDEEAVSKDLFDALIKKKSWKEVAAIIKRITAEPETVRWSVLGLANAMLLGGYGDPKRAALCIECFSSNFYDSNKAGLSLASYSVCL